MPKSNQSAHEQAAAGTHLIPVKSLRDREDLDFDLIPDGALRAEIATALAIPEIRKLRLQGTISALNAADWQLQAVLGATVVQSCVVTAAPVVTRLDVPIRRVFVKAYRLPETQAEVQFDGDDETEALPEIIDLIAILTESLSLCLPDYPRADGATLGEAVFTAPGLTPLRDEDVKPFAALAALKDKSKQ